MPNKYKKITWRKKNAQQMNDLMKSHRLQNQNFDENEITTETTIIPESRMEVTSNDLTKEINPDKTNLHQLQNVELMEVTSNDLTVEINPDKTNLHQLQNVELMEVTSNDWTNEINPDKTNLHQLQNVELQTHTSLESVSECTQSSLLDEPGDNTDWYEISNSPVNVENRYSVEGRRIIDFDYFYRRLQEICSHNKMFGCTLSNVQIISEKRKGLLSKYKLSCNMCNMIFYLDSEPQTTLDLNKAAISGIMSSGIGYSQFSELCAAMDCPSFSEKHYRKVQNETYDDWQKTALCVMEAAATRERNAAIEEGRVKNGIACIDVIADGAWSKRSYSTNFSALSGAAAIIGKRFGEVLFIGIKNKYCCICARAESKSISPVDHVCFRNYSGSSTGMESEILLEGFKQSIPMHNIIYERMVADGDSSTYKKILEGRPYSNCTVEKVECKNHIFRNMCKKLKNITTETKYPVNLRKKITTQRILAIRKVICASISENSSKDTDFDTKVNSLYTDINNSYNHAFGHHENCQPYYCTTQNNSEDVTLILKTCAVWHRIKFIVNTVAAKTRSLMHNCDSNKVESFNSIIAKFVGGKRINFSMRQGYQSRCNAAVVSFNTKRPLSTLHRAVSRRSPRKLVKKLEEKRQKRRENKSKYLRKGRKLFLAGKKDKDYGENCLRPDMPSLEFTLCKTNFLKDLQCTDDERKQIERATILQRDSSQWLEFRRKLITASNFAKVVNRRPNANVTNLIKTLIYPKQLSNVLSIKHGIENEARATEQLASQLKTNIEPCGLFVDKKLPYLGATPDGIVGDNTIIEIKCPITAYKTSLDEAIEKGKVNFWKKGENGLVNKKHPWYIQVQGQLHITGRNNCIFAVWSGCDKQMKVEVIEKDDQFWEQLMEPKLKHFYLTYLLPELCDPRHIRNMPIRDLNELK